MNSLLPWRGLFAQIVFLGALLYFARMAPEMHTSIMATLAGLGALLTQRARNQAGSESGGNSDGASLFPGQMKMTEARIIDRVVETKPPSGPHSPKVGKQFVAGLVWALFAAFAFILLTRCNQPAATTATEIEAGVSVAQGVCQEVADVTLNPIVTLICPFLDRNGKQVVENGAPKTVIVTMPRLDWENIKARQAKDGGK